MDPDDTAPPPSAHDTVPDLRRPWDVSLDAEAPVIDVLRPVTFPSVLQEPEDFGFALDANVLDED